MEIKKVEQEIQNDASKEKDNDFDKGFGGPEDDAGGNYIQIRQLAHELNSPAVEALRKWGGDAPDSKIQGNESEVKVEGKITPIPSPGGPIPTGMIGEYQDRVAAEGEGVEDPFIDPITAATAAFGVGGLTAIKGGMKLLPSLGRAISSGLIGGAADYPVGIATEAVAGKYPKLALPFSVLVGMVSGATLESRLEDVVTKALTKGGKKVTAEAVKKAVTKVKGNIGKGKIDDELTGEVTTSLNKMIEDDPVLQDLMPVSKDKPVKTLGQKQAVSVELTPEGEARLGDLFGTINRPIDELVSISPEKAQRILTSDVELPKKYAINLNLSRMNTDDSVKQTIVKVQKEMEPAIQEARRKTKSWTDTEKSANLLGMTPEQLMRRQRGTAFNAEEVLAARWIEASAAEQLHSLSAKVLSPEASQLDKAEFYKSLHIFTAIHNQASGVRAEAGRALQIFRKQAGATPTKTRQISELMKNLPADLSIEDIAERLSMIDSVEGMAKAVKGATTAKAKDMFLEAWINGLLSGPQTHAVNTISNTLYAVWQIPERVLASGISKIPKVGSGDIGIDEALSQTYGLVEGMKDGFRLAAKTLRYGETQDAVTKIESRYGKAITAENVRQLSFVKMLSPNALQEGGVAAQAVDLLGNVVRIPTRFLQAEDDLFKGIGYRMELRARASRMARQEGLTGKEAANRIQEVLGDPENLAPDLHMASIDASRYQTFTKPLEGRLLSALSSTNSPWVKLIIPFVRTPTNIFKAGIERTPLAPLMKGVRADIMAGGARRDLALARMSLGSMTMGVVATLAAEGHITGGGPTDPKLKQIKYNTGWKPYSMKIGDEYIAFNRLEPTGMLFGLAADFSEISGQLDDMEAMDIATAITASIIKNVTSKTWLKGVSEVVKAFEDPDRYSERWFYNFAGSMIPGLVAQTERVIDPTNREVWSLMDAFKARIPGYSKDLPPQRNIWGEPIIMEGGLGPDIISPIYTSTEKESPIDEEILRLKAGVSKPRRTQEFMGIKIELTPQEYDQLLVYMNKLPMPNTGKPLKRSLDRLVTSDSLYKQASDNMKEMMVKEYISIAKEMAKDKMSQTPSIAYLIKELQKQIMR